MRRGEQPLIKFLLFRLSEFWAEGNPSSAQILGTFENENSSNFMERGG